MGKRYPINSQSIIHLPLRGCIGRGGQVGRGGGMISRKDFRSLPPDEVAHKRLTRFGTTLLTPQPCQSWGKNTPKNARVSPYVPLKW